MPSRIVYKNRKCKQIVTNFTMRNVVLFIQIEPEREVD
jgi:hypothetical protein